MFKFVKGLTTFGIVSVILVFCGQFGITHFTKYQLETLASQVLGTAVSVDAVRLSFLEGRGQIKGLSIANPSGYRAQEAFGLDALTFDLAPLSLFATPILIERFTVERARATYEVNEKGLGNLNLLLERLSQQADGAEPESAQDQAETVGPRRNVAVGKISVANTELVLDFESYGKERYEETLPEFHAENVGGAEGLPPDQLGKAVVRVMLRNIITQAQARYKEKVKDGIKRKLLDALKEGVGNQLDGLLEKL